MGDRLRAAGLVICGIVFVAGVLTMWWEVRQVKRDPMRGRLDLEGFYSSPKWQRRLERRMTYAEVHNNRRRNGGAY